VITSLQAPLVKYAFKLVREAKFREETGELLIEGKTMIKEFKGEILHLLFVEDFPLKAQKKTGITKEIAKKISTTASPEGIFAIVKKPLHKEKPLSSLLVLEKISDPGNLGTLFRTAKSFLWDEIFLIGGCDPFNDKCLRASKGAVFTIPFQEGSFEDAKKVIEKNKLTPLLADISGAPFTSYLNEEKVALILGSEASGASFEMKEAFQKITIPISAMESLNVAIAGGILLHAFRR
jgi:TrmH family RNA methyltransferase